MLILTCCNATTIPRIPPQAHISACKNSAEANRKTNGGVYVLHGYLEEQMQMPRLMTNITYYEDRHRMAKTDHTCAQPNMYLERVLP